MIGDSAVIELPLGRRNRACYWRGLNTDCKSSHTEVGTWLAHLVSTTHLPVQARCNLTLWSAAVYWWRRQLAADVSADTRLNGDIAVHSCERTHTTQLHAASVTTNTAGFYTVARLISPELDSKPVISLFNRPTHRALKNCRTVINNVIALRLRRGSVVQTIRFIHSINHSFIYSLYHSHRMQW